MNIGDNVLITYKKMENSTVLATFYETNNGIHYFKNATGIFGVTEKKVQDKEIEFEIIED